MLRVCIKRYQIQKQGYLFHSVDKSKDLKHASTECSPVHEQRLFHSVQQFPDAEWQLPLMDDAVRKRVATVPCFPANRRLPLMKNGHTHCLL